jgi:tRNA U34 5-carboxymethylaminomethyl modifying GTPase MnmE/TrmE
MSLRILLPRQAVRRWDVLRHVRSFASSARRSEPGVSETIDDMVGKLRQTVSEVTKHSGQYEGVQEEGLRMLMFGKPGSGKVSLQRRVACS